MTDSRPPLRAPELPSGERADDLLYRPAPGERLPLPHQYAPGAPRPGAASFRTGLPPLTVRSDPAEVDVCALTDGGGGVRALRVLRALGGRRLPVADDGFVRAPADEPGGWLVQETCTRVGHDGTSLLLHTEMGGYVSVAAEGVKVAARGNLFEIEYAERGEQAVPRAAAAADAVFVVVGIAPHGNVRESKGRTTLALPAHRLRLRRAARAADPRPAHAQVSSCLCAVPEADAALLGAAHGGRPTGTALVRVPAGDVSRAGRLPQTRYAHDEDPPNLFDHDVIGSRPTCLYVDGFPRHSLGHGLGHASSLCPGPTAVRESAPLPAAPTVTGSLGADEVARLSARAAESCPVARPSRQPVGRHRIHLAPGAARCVEADVPAAAEPGLWAVARDRWTVRRGTYEILAGSSSEDARLIRAVRVDGAPPAARPVQGTGLAAATHDEQHGNESVDGTRTRGYAVTTASGDEGELRPDVRDFGPSPEIASSTGTDTVTDATPDAAPSATLDAAPGVAPDAAPGASLDAAPRITPDAAPRVTSYATPGATNGPVPGAAPAATPGAAPSGATAHVTVHGTLGGSGRLPAGHATATVTLSSGGSADAYATWTVRFPVHGVRYLRSTLRGPVVRPAGRPARGHRAVVHPDPEDPHAMKLTDGFRPMREGARARHATVVRALRAHDDRCATYVAVRAECCVAARPAPTHVLRRLVGRGPRLSAWGDPCIAEKAPAFAGAAEPGHLVAHRTRVPVMRPVLLRLPDAPACRTPALLTDATFRAAHEGNEARVAAEGSARSFRLGIPGGAAWARGPGDVFLPGVAQGGG
ncbi:glycoside hydrolase family 3 C-terminal domain-containing protein [Streptomyces longispororuber]|uniref:glycoside hydrolase family 3 C-terminal domain-containing protein n=1 Tax=Streptomyces longispororuber TaxID=68230 RepID=UPI0033C995CD